jgi:hypothetical protein
MVVVATATAGILFAVGVGEDDSRMNIDTGAQENRINRVADRVAERLAGDIVQQSPDVCDLVNRSSPTEETNVFEVVVFGDSEPGYWARLSGEDKAAASDRLTEKLRTECEGQGNDDGS